MRRNKIVWSESKVRELAPQFSSRTEFSRAYRGGYRYALSVPGLLDELFGNQKFVWTEDALDKLMFSCSSRCEFQEKNGGAYVAAVKSFKHLLDKHFARKIKNWKDESSVIEEAAKFASRAELKRNSPGCYKSAVAKFPHALDTLYGEATNKPISLDEAVDALAKCGTRAEAWRKANAACYRIIREGLDLNDYAPKGKESWADESKIRSEASKYRTKTEFIHGCVAAYGAARRLGILEDLGFEDATFGFSSKVQSYIYFAEITTTSGEQSVLFGVTNNHPRFRYKKYEIVGMRNNIAFVLPTGRMALDLETRLKRVFIHNKVGHGESPLRFKKGTSGEIVVGLELEDVLRHIPEVYQFEKIEWGLPRHPKLLKRNGTRSSWAYQPSL